MELINSNIYRNPRIIKWGTSIESAVQALSSQGLGMQMTLIGKHGFGKSTVLEVISERNPEALIVEGDLLYTLAFMLMREEAPETPLGGVEVWRWLKADESLGRYRQLEDLLDSLGLLKRIDLTTNFTDKMKQVTMVVPDYEFYRKSLKRRTADMLKQDQWKGYTADHWPVLSYPEFVEWIRTQKEKVTGYLPNLGPASDEIWAAWWKKQTVGVGAKNRRR
jgi:hypothetical protein